MEPTKIERRSYVCEFRAEGESRILRGHAAIFDEVADLGAFHEIVKRGAFDGEGITGDVRALFNHDPSLILGRSGAGTLRLSINERGLAYEIDTPETTYGNDLLVSVSRGDVSQSSFAFYVREEGDEWDWNREVPLRTIHRARVADVSPVTYPAYTGTDVSTRSVDDVQAILLRAREERQARSSRLLRRARYWALKGETL